MFDHQHNHGGGCCGGHGQDDHEHGAPLDPASQSLSDALRVSFRLLTLIMILVLIAFALTGIRMIDANKVGVKKIFGAYVGTTSQGLAFNWPFPVGDIEEVLISEQTLPIDDLWMFESAQDKSKPMDQRQASTNGLRPGWDGAVLTGDRRLLHVRLVVGYAINDALAYKKHLPEQFSKVMNRQVDATQDLLRTVVCDATIRSAATRTAEAIKSSEKEDFTIDIRKRAQDAMNELFDGTQAVTITKVSTTVEWPLRALPAWAMAQNAARDARQEMQKAISDADQILKSTVGSHYATLVGVPWQQVSAGGDETTTKPAAGQYVQGLIGQYMTIRAELERTKAQLAQATSPDKAALEARIVDGQKQADEMLAQIDGELQSNRTAGQVAGVLEKARTDYFEIVNRTQGRLRIFRDNLSGYQQAPEQTINRLWADAKEEILNSPLIEKHFVTVDDGKTIVRITSDPDIRGGISKELMKKAKENK